MIDPLVVLIYSHKAGYQTYLEHQLKEAGIERFDMPLKSFSWLSQLIATREAGLLFPDRLLLVIDSWDQVLLGTKKELQQHAKDALVGHVTLAGAKNCWPDDRRADYFAKRGPEASPWQYINNSPLAGLGKDIAKAIEWGMERFPIKGDSALVSEPTGEVPERFWTRLFLDGPSELGLRIDTKCELNQIHIGIGTNEVVIKKRRLYNTVTKSWPIFLHLNGGATLPFGIA
jgi:hypothetical protein